MDQFIINPVLMGESLEWYSFTNQALWMLISLACISFVFIYGSRKHQLVPGRLQSVAELMYFFIRDMIIDIAGQEGLRYFPYIFTLFILILFVEKDLLLILFSYIDIKQLSFFITLLISEIDFSIFEDLQCCKDVQSIIISNNLSSKGIL